MLKPVRTVAPLVEPISLEEARARLRIDHHEEDPLIAALIAAATALLDGWSGILRRALINQTWVQKFPRFPAGAVLGLALAPVQSIVSVSYFDADNVQRTLDASVYALLDDELGPFVTRQVDQAWPATFAREDAVSVTYVAGYGPSGDDVPAAIRHAMHLIIGHWYEHRESVVVGTNMVHLPLAVNALLGPYRGIRL